MAGLAASTLVAAAATPSNAAAVRGSRTDLLSNTALLQQPPSKTAQKVPPAKSSKTATKAPAPKGDPALPVTYVTAGEGNLARYRVRERLAGKELDNDAVGETPKVMGTIVLDKSGAIVAGQSGFTAELSLLKSDQTRRDRFVRSRILKTDSFPSTSFKVTSVRGLPSPLPTSGETRFQLLGDLTVKGVTRPSVWDVVATVVGNQLKGSAKTQFTFKEFALEQPRVAIVLSLADTIGLEYDFVMTRKTP